MNTLLLLAFSTCLFAWTDAVAFYSISGGTEWDSFKAMYGKQYTPIEETFRRKIFLENHMMIHEHNVRYRKGSVSYAMEINEFADLLPHEFKSLMLGLAKPFRGNRNTSTTYLSPSNVLVPDRIDWREKGYVTEVKNQEQCGSCWAFSTTGSLEGQHFRKTGELVSLSEQNLIDCSDKNNGCNGGLMDFAFKYIQDNGGIDTESLYQYEGKGGQCRFKKSAVGATVSGFVDLPQEDELALKEALGTIGPISVAIDAGCRSFQFYSHGVYYEPKCSSEDLDHGVLAVGYGTEQPGGDYWLIKNSWGGSWGEQGYIKMARNKRNNCGVATSPSYPLV